MADDPGPSKRAADILTALRDALRPKHKIPDEELVALREAARTIIYSRDEQGFVMVLERLGIDPKSNQGKSLIDSFRKLPRPFG